MTERKEKRKDSKIDFRLNQKVREALENRAASEKVTVGAVIRESVIRNLEPADFIRQVQKDRAIERGKKLRAEKDAEDRRLQALLDREKSGHARWNAKCSVCNHTLQTHKVDAQTDWQNEPYFFSRCRGRSSLPNDSSGVRCECESFTSPDSNVEDWAKEQNVNWYAWAKKRYG